MREPVDRDILGTTYRVTPLPAGRGVRVMARIARTLGLLAGKSGDFAKEPSEAIFALVAEAAEHLDPAALDATIRDLVEFSWTVSPGKLVHLKDCWELHFQGDYLALFEWLAFALEVNFAPLLEGLKGKLASAGRAASAAADR